MNSKFVKYGIIAAVIFVIGAYLAGGYNKIITLDEAVDSSWSQVENQYQRRYDLIGNLVETVKGYAKHEDSLYKEIAEARSKAGGVINIDSSITNDPEKLAEFQKIQSELGSSLQRLMAVSESYPELKANQNFLALQDQLEGTENRIATERMRFNETVKNYNKAVRRFPGNLFAGFFGFEKKNYFAADAGAQKAPEVKF